MPFGPVDPDLDLVALEDIMLERWREHDVAALAQQRNKDREPWIFYEGPPTANGKPGLHHVWARVFKDLYPRFQTMRGRQVPRKGGWDCHGLPVELEVEKELGLHSKQEIEAFGVEAFNQRCRESVQRYVADWAALTARSGAWIDTEDAYWTLSNDYIESVWWLLSQLWEKGLLYEGHKVSPYCSRCGTALSSHELGQPDVYRDIVDPSVYVRFPLVDATTGPFAGADLLVWTTTPWTLISNVAAAVGPRHRLRPRARLGLRRRGPRPRRRASIGCPKAPSRPPWPRATSWSTSRTPDRSPTSIRPPGAQGLAGRGGRVRHDRRGHGHRAPRPGVRRGRQRRRPARGAPRPEPGRRRRHVRRAASRPTPASS